MEKFITIITSNYSFHFKVRVPGYRSWGPGSILGFSAEKQWVWNRVHSAS
jgi:hypothetical protein